MSYKLQINITKEVLQKSKMCSNDGYIKGESTGVGSNCAIAMAIRDVFPRAWVSREEIFPNFFKNYTELEKDNFTKNIEFPIDLPFKASKFITRFDTLSPKNRINMESISFEIEIPEEIINEIGISEVKEILKECKTMELV